MSRGQSRLLVRADSGPAIGTASVLRTLALASAWKRRGGTATFVCGDLPHGLIHRIESHDFNVIQIQNCGCDGADAKDTSEIASVVQPDWIVLDGNRFDDSYQRAVRSHAFQLAVIDGTHATNHPYADLILNQHLLTSSRMYPDSCRGKVLAGPQFALIPGATHQDIRASREPKRIHREATRVLINFAGTDDGNWTLQSLQVLASLKRKRLAIDCFVSANYSRVDDLMRFKRSDQLNVRVHRHLDRLSSMISRFDLAITDGGSHGFELIRRGVPTLVAATDNSQDLSRKLNRRGLIVSLEPRPSKNKRDDTPGATHESCLQETIEELIVDANRRKSLSELGQRWIDGNGAHRIARSLTAGMFSIRQANGDDVDTLWRWQNDPEVRSVSFDSRPISHGPFVKTFRNQLADPTTQTWIAESADGQPIGAVRFDSIQPTQPTPVRVVIDQARRGRGLGTLLISRACQAFLRESESNWLIAQIKPGNTASEKAFRAAGFVGIEPAVIKGIMVNQFQLNRDVDLGAPSVSGRARKSA